MSDFDLIKFAQSSELFDVYEIDEITNPIRNFIEKKIIIPIDCVYRLIDKFSVVY